jgi:threonine/homoserine/homoserine lactone efflux protein
LFSYDLAHWATFLVAVVLLELSPGPDMAFILGHTVKGGVRNGMTALAGVWFGVFGHILLAVSGLSAILAASVTAFSVVKWAGVLYLVWLGVQSLRSNGGSFSDETAAAQVSRGRIFRQGALIDLLNPKVALFFLAFLPQFVVPGAGPVWAQLLFHGMVLMVVSVIIQPPVVLLGGLVTRKLRSSNALAKWLDRSLGALLIALAAKLALTER